MTEQTKTYIYTVEIIVNAADEQSADNVLDQIRNDINDPDRQQAVYMEEWDSCNIWDKLHDKLLKKRQSNN